jgi:hypothetical protein
MTLPFLDCVCHERRQTEARGSEVRGATRSAFLDARARRRVQSRRKSGIQTSMLRNGAFRSRAIAISCLQQDTPAIRRSHRTSCILGRNHRIQVVAAAPASGPPWSVDRQLSDRHRIRGREPFGPVSRRRTERSVTAEGTDNNPTTEFVSSATRPESISRATACSRSATHWNIVPLHAPTSSTRLPKYGEASEKIQSRYRGAFSRTSRTRPRVGDALSVTRGASREMAMAEADPFPGRFIFGGRSKTDSERE